jgi:hypothetical protein
MQPSCVRIKYGYFLLWKCISNASTFYFYLGKLFKKYFYFTKVDFLALTFTFTLVFKSSTSYNTGQYTLLPYSASQIIAVCIKADEWIAVYDDKIMTWNLPCMKSCQHSTHTKVVNGFHSGQSNGCSTCNLTRSS